MNRRLHWDDLRLILAVAEAGSLSGAGRRLGQSHATVFRRLAQAEARIGAKLFDRARTGYVPTVAGEEAAAAARRIETEVLDVERRIAGHDLRPSGTVRVTTTDTLMFGVMSPIFGRFRAAHPEIALEVAIANEPFNLSRREADVALRPARTPPETLVGRRLAAIAQCVYGARALAAAATDGDWPDTAGWIGPDERMRYPDLERWMAANALDSRCHYRVDALLGIAAACADGAGLAALPCYIGDADPRLVRFGAPVPELATDLWLLTHPDLRATARVRAFNDFVAAAVTRERDRLAGVGAPAAPAEML